jgi:hypothetical protein
MAKQANKLLVPYRNLSLAIQDVIVHRRFPNFQGQITPGIAIWRGPLQPRPVSPVYHIEIQYQLKKTPHVWVVSPHLVSGAPHRWRDKSLCLYWYKEWEWHPGRLIAEIIIPLTASWLYYYELWLDTGKWLGPSSHENPLNDRMIKG